jgi:hypothetical protein
MDGKSRSTNSDIHSLYDLDFIAIDPDTCEVALSPPVCDSAHITRRGQVA